MVFLSGGHYAELQETLGAGLPAIFATIAFSLLLLVLAAIPPSVLPVGISDLLAPRRRQVAVVGISVCLASAIGLLTVFWAL
jgi:hypothetical protein